MSKSRARFLSELLGTTGLVKKAKSALAGADEVIDLDVLPSIPNSKLTNSSISIAGHSTALGGSVSLNTGDISEHTNYPYFTNARARGAVSVSGDLAYNSSTGVISFTERTDAEVRGLVSAGGSLSYNSTTGVFSYTTPTTIASLSNHDTADLAEGTNLYFTNARADARIAAASTSDLSEGTNLYYTDARADARIAAADTGDLSEGSNLYYTNARADARIAAATTDDLSEGSSNLYYTDARADARVALIVDSAPGTLNTLNELAAALGDDANFSTTVTNSIATKMPLAGGTFTGDVIIEKSGNPSFTVKTTGAGNNPFLKLQAATNYWEFLGIFSNSDDELDIRYNGSSKLEIDNSGNATFAGTISSGAITSSGNITAGNSGNINIPTASSGNANMSFDGSNFTLVSNSSSANLKLQTNSQDTLTIAANGNITHHRGNANLGTISSGHHTITTTGTGNGLFVNGGGNTGQIKVGDYTRITGATTSNAGAFSFNANHQGAQLSTWVPDYAGSASAGMFVLRQDGGGQGSTSVWVKNSGTTSTAQNLSTFTKVAQFHQDGYFSTPAGLRVGSTEVISSARAITATSVGVTNIVTNKVVKFDGTVLNDSNITDTGSLITLGSNTTINGKIVAGDATSTNGDVLLEGYYGNGATVVIGSERSSGGLFLGYGVQPSTTTQHQFLSSTPITLTQSAYVAADTHRWWTASSGSAVALGSQVTTMTQRMTILANGNVGIGADSPSDKLEVSRTSTDQTVGLTLTNLQNGGYGSGIVWKSKRSDAPNDILDTAKIVVAGENAWNSDANTASQMQFWTQKDNTLTKHMTLTKNGNLGIGTPSPTSGLHVSKSPDGNNATTYILQSGATNAPTLRIAQTGNGGNPNVTQGLLIEVAGTNDGSSNLIRAVGKNSNINSGVDVEAFVVKNGGNVGIGTATPQRKLTVTGAADSAGDNTGIIQLSAGTGINTDSKMLFGIDSSHRGYIHVVKPGNNVMNLVLNPTGSANGTVQVYGPGNTAGGNLKIGGHGANSTDRWSLLTGTHYNDSSQSKGISLIGSFSNSTSNVVAIGGNVYEANPATQIEFWTHTATTHSQGGTRQVVINNTNVDIISNGLYMASTLLVDTNRNISAATVSSAGKLAVMSSSVHGSYDLYNNGTTYFNGVTTIDARLNVVTAGAEGLVLHQDTGSTNNSARLFLNGSSGNWAIFNNSNILKFNHAATVGSSSGSQAASLTTAGLLTVVSLTESSSIRYKENVKPITNGLEVINKFEPVTYDRTDNDSKNEPGFIAEEVLKFLPNVINHNEEGEVESIKYTKIIAYLVDAVQELSAEVEKLKNG